MTIQMTLDEMKVISKNVWAVFSNTDLTEGRGREYIKYFCESKITAMRLGKDGYVMGTPAPIRQVKVYSLPNEYGLFGRVHVILPNEEDKEKQKDLDKATKFKQFCESNGISIEELREFKEYI